MTVTQCRILCLDVTTRKTFEKELLLFGKLATDKKIIDKAREMIDTEIIKAVYVMKHDIVTKRFTMSAQKFIDYAEEQKEEKECNTE